MTADVTFDPDKLLARQIDRTVDWNARDTVLYALGVGADELRFVYEEGLQALPTMAVVLGYPGFDFWRAPELGVDTARILHGETDVELHGTLPTEGRVYGSNRVVRLIDKGADRGAVALQERTISDARGRLLATVRNTTLLRGNGGFGGSSEGQAAPRPVPADRPADLSVTLNTRPDQALLYRLSGDVNPLHIDPAAAAAAGFSRPILHGLCTFGVVGRGLLRALCDNDPARLRRIGGRFSSPVFPGETIRTEIWRDGNRAAFRAHVVERDVVVLDNGFAELA